MFSRETVESNTLATCLSGEPPSRLMRVALDWRPSAVPQQQEDLAALEHRPGCLRCAPSVQSATTVTRSREPRARRGRFRGP